MDQLSKLISQLREKRSRGNDIIVTPDSFSSWFSQGRLHDGLGNQLVIILTTRGCSHFYSNHGGCSMCGYNNETPGSPIPKQVISGQFINALEKNKEHLNGSGPIVLKIFNSGSFLDEREIPRDLRDEIFAAIAKVPSIKEIAIESRVEYIKKPVLRKISTLLREDQF